MCKPVVRFKRRSLCTKQYIQEPVLVERLVLQGNDLGGFGGEALTAHKLRNGLKENIPLSCDSVCLTLGAKQTTHVPARCGMSKPRSQAADFAGEIDTRKMEKLIFDKVLHETRSIARVDLSCNQELMRL